jgi:alpha-ribazole phosphatase
MRVLLIRHLTPLIGKGICYGRLDIPMHPAGLDQARAIAAHAMLHGVMRVWSSPAQRCRSLAEIIADTGPTPVAFDPRLLELDFGEWEGKPWDDIERAELDRWAATPLTFRAPGGETGASLIERVRAFHADLCRTGEDSVVVAHGGPLKVLTALLQGRPIDLLGPAPSMGSVVLVPHQAHPDRTPLHRR